MNCKPGVVFLLGSLFTWGQSYYGSVRGLIQDQAGSVIASAKVTLIDESAGAARSTISTAEGEFLFSQAVPATYTLVAEAPGFRRLERKGIVLATQQALSIDLKLEIGEVTQSIQVTEDAPLLETATASQGQVIDRQKMIDLPNLGRNPFMMSKLAQNVVQVGNPAYNRMQDQSGSSMISIAGGPVRGNNYLLDGIPITDSANRAIISPSIEAVQEMKVQANTYDAEMARTGGGMFNTFLRSGANEYHGSLLGYIRETEWLANTFFNNRNGLPIRDQPFRNYGGSFGGAVRVPKLYDGRNRTFFWTTFEGYRDTQANSSEFVTPTLRERAGDFSQSRTAIGATHTIFDPLTTRLNPDGSYTRTPFAGNLIPGNRLDPAGLNIAATYMPPSSEARFFGDQNLSGNTTLPSKADQKTIKLDHQMTTWWRASLSFLHYDSTEPGDTWFPTVSSPAQWRLKRVVDSTQVNNLITPTPSTVVNIRYGFNRFMDLGFQRSQGFDVASLGFAPAFVRDIPSQTFPNIGMQALYSLGTNNNFHTIFHSRNLLGSVAKYFGRHSLKFGADYRRINTDGINFGNSSGQFSFNDTFTRATPARQTTGTGADIASMLLGAPASGSGFVPTKIFNYVDYASFFFQDDFRVSSRLTLNLGIRWERETGLAERNDALIVGFDRNAINPLAQNVSGILPLGQVRFAGQNGNPRTVGNPILNKWGPRFGAAWQVDRNTTLRGGYGIYWAPQYAITSGYTPEGFTATTPYVGSDDGGATPAGTLQNPFPGGLLRPAGTQLGGLTGIGNALTVFDQDARSTRVQQYSFDLQRQLPGGMVLSAGYVGSKTSNLLLGSALVNINQVEPRFYALGAALTETVPNPYFGNGGTGVIGGRTVTRAQLLRPFSAFGNINLQFSDFNSARYDSMVVKLQKRMSAGLSVLSTWTWSINRDATSGGAGNNLNAGQAAPQNVYDLASEYSLSNFHTPHRWTTAITYELPFGKGKPMLAGSRMLDYFAGGWSINAVSLFQSGFPLNITQNSNNNAVIFAASQRPDATGVSPVTDGSLASRIDNYINPAAFSQASRFTFGNVSRTLSLRGPGQANWDISIFKTFTIYEQYKAQFRAEALNAFNTPLFRSPNAVFGNSQFGRITSQANFPRMIQLGLRIYF